MPPKLPPEEQTPDILGGPNVCGCYLNISSKQSVRRGTEEVNGAPRLQKTPRHLTDLRPGQETLQYINGFRKKLFTISWSRIQFPPYR